MTQDPGKIIPDTAPFSSEQNAWLNSFLPALSQEQVLWFSGFFAGMRAARAGGAVQGQAIHSAPAQKRAIPLTILYGSESGNAEGLAAEVEKQAKKRGFEPKILDMGDCEPSALAKAENIVVIVSTWGEGDPPERAVAFHEAFMDDDQSPRLPNARFSVCGLGDTSYEHFCEMGKQFDTRLEALGARRIHARVDCDVDYEDDFEGWLGGVFHELEEIAGAAAPAANFTTSTTGSAAGGVYDKKNPFPAELKDRVVLNGTGSSKETIHLELSLEGSGLTYEPGDSVGIMPTNCPEVVTDILKALNFTGSETVTRPNGESATLDHALVEDCDVTGLNRTLIERYTERSKSKKLGALLENTKRDELNAYLWGRQIVDLLHDYPVKDFSPDDLVTFLRKLPPRLYSIASSLKAHPEEVHLCVAAVRYSSHGRYRKGVCSTFLADRVDSGSKFPIYIHRNNNFRLPLNQETPVIMVGPGTGVAPFRAFIEERQAVGAKGKNWLFFGDQHFNYDFLYQLEWQSYLKDGILNRMNVAFSRDLPEKVYVQHKMLEQARELYRWLEEGAYFYVCGDASRMAGDVHEALIDIVAEQGGKSRDDAEAYVQQMTKDKRYQRDVY